VLAEHGGVNFEVVFNAGFECRKSQDDLASSCFDSRGASGVRLTGRLPDESCQDCIGGSGDNRVNKQYTRSHAVFSRKI
jgi:hypothetical protein